MVRVPLSGPSNSKETPTMAFLKVALQIEESVDRAGCVRNDWEEGYIKDLIWRVWKPNFSVALSAHHQNADVSKLCIANPSIKFPHFYLHGE